MTKRNKRNMRRGSRRARGNGGRVGEMVFRGKTAGTISATTTGSALTLDSFVSAGTGAVLTNLGDTFQNYRFEDLRLTIYPYANGTSNQTFGIGYQNEISDGVPTNVSNVMQYPWSQILTNSVNVPLKVRVPRSVLIQQGLEKWWRTQLPSQTNTGTGTLPTSNLWETVQGVFWFIASAAVSVTYALSYVVRLSSPIVSGLSPSPRNRTEAVLGWHYQGISTPGLYNPYGICIFRDEYTRLFHGKSGLDDVPFCPLPEEEDETKMDPTLGKLNSSPGCALSFPEQCVAWKRRYPEGDDMDYCDEKKPCLACVLHYLNQLDGRRRS